MIAVRWFTEPPLYHRQKFTVNDIVLTSSVINAAAHSPIGLSTVTMCYTVIYRNVALLKYSQTVAYQDTEQSNFKSNQQKTLLRQISYIPY